MAVLRTAFSFPDGVSADHILATFGLVRYGQPVLLRAPLSLSGTGGSVMLLPYVDIAPELLDAVTTSIRASYPLITENLTTFNRYVREVRDDGLVLYADGFPTRL